MNGISVFFLGCLPMVSYLLGLVLVSLLVSCYLLVVGSVGLSYDWLIFVVPYGDWNWFWSSVISVIYGWIVVGSVGSVGRSEWNGFAVLGCVCQLTYLGSILAPCLLGSDLFLPVHFLN